MQTSRYNYHYKKPKKQRSYKALVLIIVVVVLAFAWQQSRNMGSKPSVKSSSTINKTPVTSRHYDEGLESSIETWAKAQKNKYGVSVVELNGSLRTAEYNATASFGTASTYKVFVAFALLHGIESGAYKFNQTTTTGKNLQECLNIMIVNSDNPCGKALGFLVGWKKINSLIQTHGMTNTDLFNYIGTGTDPVSEKHTTAQDEATLLELLQQGKLLDKSHTNLLLSLMKRQVYRERIAAGLPKGTVVASKPGWSENIQNDMGIVYGPKSTYAVVILSNVNSPAPLAKLSAIIYDYLN